MKNRLSYTVVLTQSPFSLENAYWNTCRQMHSERHLQLCKICKHANFLLQYLSTFKNRTIQGSTSLNNPIWIAFQMCNPLLYRLLLLPSKIIWFGYDQFGNICFLNFQGHTGESNKTIHKIVLIYLGKRNYSQVHFIMLFWVT